MVETKRTGQPHWCIYGKGEQVAARKIYVCNSCIANRKKMMQLRQIEKIPEL